MATFKTAKFDGIEFIYTVTSEDEYRKTHHLKREIYIEWCRAQARKVLTEDDYNELIEAIEKDREVIFMYTNKEAEIQAYKKVKPIEFFLAPGYYDGIKAIEDELNPIENGGRPLEERIDGTVYLWAYHARDENKESFYAATIIDVNIIPTLLEALRDPSRYWYYWKGLTEEEEEEKVPEIIPKEEEEKPISTPEELLQALSEATTEEEKNQIVLEWLKNNIPAETTLIAGPSTDIEHEAYTVIFDGVPIYFDEINDATVALVRELFVGNPLPDFLKDIVEGIQIVAEDARGGPDVVGMSADGFVTIFGNREVDTGIIAHEIAHDFAATKWGDMFPAADSAYQKAIDSGEPPVSEYAKKNTGEDFAEAVRMYVDDPDQLQMDYPERYKVIDRLMKDKNYGG